MRSPMPWAYPPLARLPSCSTASTGSLTPSSRVPDVRDAHNTMSTYVDDYMMAAVGVATRRCATASKAAIMGLTRDLAQQWGSRKGIRVNAIAPGFFESEMTSQYQLGYLNSLLRASCWGDW